MKSNRLIFILFFLSGLAGLIYEIVWGRQLVLIFGSTTNSLVATISAYLGGLALGSFLAGKIADQLNPKQLLRAYSLLELGVGLSALASPFLFLKVKILYSLISDGSSVTFSLIAIKFLLTSLIILIPTTLMGATLPFLVRFLELTTQIPNLTLSRLYAINTLGGVCGVLSTGFILIELFGLNQTLYLAVSFNIFISLIALFLPVNRYQKLKSHQLPIQINRSLIIPLLGFAISGFISIAYQILWTRVLTPTMGTMIYAFSGILALYLFGIALGSFLYPIYRRIVPSTSLAFGLIQLSLGIFALIPVLVIHKTELMALSELVLRIFIPTILFGLTFPATISLINQPKASGQVIGFAYTANTIGAILSLSNNNGF